MSKQIALNYKFHVVVLTGHHPFHGVVEEWIKVFVDEVGLEGTLSNLVLVVHLLDKGDDVGPLDLRLPDLLLLGHQEIIAELLEGYDVIKAFNTL